MTILVTGGAGYIGGHVIRELLDAGEAVVVIDDLSTGPRAAVPPDVPLIVGDCGDEELVAATLEGHQVCAVIDLAGRDYAADGPEDGKSSQRLRDLIGTVASHGVPHFVSSSSCEVYGDGGQLPISENATTAPISRSGRSALLGERMLRALASTSGMQFVTLRLFDVAGTDPQLRPGLTCGRSTGLLRRAIRTALAVEPYLEIDGTGRPTPDGTCVRDYVQVTDVARAYVAALGYLRAGGPSATFNCGSGHGHSALEVVAAAERASGQTLPVRYVAARADDVSHCVADIRRVREALDWAPRFDRLDDTARHVLAWEQHRQQRQLDASQAFLRIVAESGVPVARLQRLVSGFGSRQAGRSNLTPPRQIVRERVSPGAWPSPTSPTEGARRLTIGMATYDDYDGVYFTLQALRLHQAEALDDVEFIVVDRDPTGPCAAALKDLERWIPGYRYVPHDEASETTARDRIFEEARGDFVLCLDCHVLLAPGSLARLMAYLRDTPETNDLLQGPLVRDDLRCLSTHLRPAWRQGAYGVAASDPAGADPGFPPFEIPMQDMGLLVCMRKAWPGAHPQFRGLWGHEGYIHEQIRRRGGEVLCLPFLRWTKRLHQPMGTTYNDHHWEDRVANYLIGFRALAWNTDAVIDHYKTFLGAQAWAAVAQRLAARSVWFENAHPDMPKLEPAGAPTC